MERKNIRILLNEPNFTQLCKMGYFTHNGSLGKSDIHITKADMKQIATGKVLVKDSGILGGDIFEIALQDIGLVLIREILRRSPVFSEMASDVEFNK